MSVHLSNAARALAAAVVVSACGGGATGSYSAFDVRTGVAAPAWSQFSPQQKQMLRQGKYEVGMPEIAMYIARGRPAFYWNTTIGDVGCQTLLYSFGKSKSQINRVVYSCGGVIAHSAEIRPALPCWRMAAVAPRIVQREKYFSKQSLERQWELVVGLLERGHTSDDVYIGFGKPYNSGREVREDGTQASTQVFLDHGGESYGLYVTLVDGKVASWKVPAERKLTPEAQKKRMEAMEKRLMDQLKTMEANAERRHRETVAHLNKIQENQAQIREDIKNQTAKVVAAAALGAYAGAAAGSSGGGSTPPPDDGGGSEGADPGDGETVDPLGDDGGDAEEPKEDPKAAAERRCKAKLAMADDCRAECPQSGGCADKSFECLKACATPNKKKYRRCTRKCRKKEKRCAKRAKRAKRKCEAACTRCN